MTEYAWHVHHTGPVLEILIEPIEERAAFIRTHKPPEEVELRLRLLHKVTGQLPAAYLAASDAYVQASAAYRRASYAYEQAGAVLDRARAPARAAHSWAGDAYVQASAANSRAGDACIQAGAALDQAYANALPEIMALHMVECPDCPWDGQTIFTEA